MKGSTTTTNVLGQLHSVDGFHNYNQSLGQLHSVDGFHNYNQSLGQLHSVDGFHNYNQSLGQLHSVDGFLQLQPITGIKLSLCVMGSTTTTNHWVSYTLLMGSYNYNLITEVSYTLCDGFHNYNQSLGQLHSVDGFLQLQLDH